MEPEIDEANVLIARLNAAASLFSDAAWTLEQILHNLRINAVGSSGIQHRVIQDREALLRELRERIDAGKKNFLTPNSNRRRRIIVGLAAQG